MQLILSVEALKPPLTGIGRYTWELARRLCRSTDFNPRFFRNGSWVSVSAAPSSTAPGDQPEVRRLAGIPALLPKAWRIRHMARVSRHALFHGPNYFAPHWAENSVVTVHDLSVFKYPESHPVERVRQFERLFSASVRQARTLITDSEAVRSEVIDFLGCPPEKVVAVPLGISERYTPLDEERWQAHLPDTQLNFKRYVLCVSTLEPRKNIEKLIAAYRQLPIALRKQYPLVVIGSTGWAGEPLLQAVADAQAEGWFHYLGYVDEAQLPVYYAGAALLVLPSKYEGFGLPVIEALACGVPVIASDIPVLREVSRGGARFFDPDDEAEFAAALQDALEDARWQAKTLQDAAIFAQQYSWEACFDATSRIYLSQMK